MQVLSIVSNHLWIVSLTTKSEQVQIPQNLNPTKYKIPHPEEAGRTSHQNKMCSDDIPVWRGEVG